MRVVELENKKVRSHGYFQESGHGEAMTPLQFTNRRKKLFRTQAAAAAALGVTPQAVSRWECGAPMPLWAIKFLECLESQRNSS